MMNLYTERYEIVIIEQPSERITEGISPIFKSLVEAREFIERSVPLVETYKYAIRKTVVSYLN